MKSFDPRHAIGVAESQWLGWLEPVTPLFLACHGAFLLSDSSSVPLQWVLVAVTAALGIAGIAGFRSPTAMRSRAWLLLLITLALLYVSGGVAAFFTLWLFMLAAVYPLVLEGNAGLGYSLTMGVSYVALTPLSDSGLAPAVLFGRATVIIAIGLVVAGISSSRRVATQRLLTSKDEFVASVSHELRTPLTAVVGFASELDRLADEIDRPDIKEYSGAVHRQAMEVADIVEDLLVAARASNGTFSIIPSSVDLHAEALRVLSEVAPTYGFSVEDVEVDGAPAPAWADPARIRQVLRNLMVNAGRHGGGRVVLRVRDEGACAVVEVADDGAGIAEAETGRMFRPYQRFHRDDGRPDSIGLGLAVSKTLAQLMDGDVSYHRIDGWTVFRLELPRDQSERIATAPSSAEFV